MRTQWTWTSPGPSATRELGRLIGELAPPGLVIALVGDLGAGKTCLVQGLARGIGVPAEMPITSPTFSIVNPYDGRLRLYHLDLYRLGGPEELEVLGFRDLLGGDAVTVVEWADRFPEVFPACHLRLEIDHRSERTRTFRFEARGGGAAEALLEALKQRLLQGSHASPSRRGSRKDRDEPA